MKRALLSFAAILLLGIAPRAGAEGLEIRLGAFVPRADTGAVNDLFTDDSELYTVSKSDWTDFTFGVQYNFKLARYLELGVSFDGYWQELQTSYRDYERDDSGRDIYQTLKIDIWPMGAELRLTPTSRRAKVAPYIGVGGDLFYWKYEEWGEFVDFSAPCRQGRPCPIFEDSFIAEGVTPGFHVSGGIRFAVSDDVGIVVGARHQWGTADMGDDFRGNKLDLTGASYTAGVTLRF